MNALAENPRAVIGGNNAPEPTPFDLVKTEIEDLYDEAKNWLDGEGVNSQSDADGVSKLLDLLRKATTAADEARKAENKPFDDGKAAIQAKYAPLIADTKAQRGKAVLAMDACKKALAPWLAKVEAEKLAIAAKAREEAEAKRLAAEAAIRAANAADLEQREKAEALLRDAKQADAIATRAENSKAHAKGGARAVGLRTHYRHEIVDGVAFARHAWIEHREELMEFLNALAKRQVEAGRHTMPGVVVHLDRVL